MRTIKHTFLNANGHELSGRLDLPADGRPAAYALFSHCFTGSKNLSAVRNISRALLQEDIAVFRFDFTGLGESEGDFAQTNFSSNVDDLLAAANFMKQQGFAPQVLIGHSLGGAAAIMASPKIESIKATVTIGTPSHPAHVQHLFQADIATIEAQGEAEVSLGGRPFRIQKQFLQDLESQDLGGILANLERALLIMHSPQDSTVNIKHAANLYQGARHPKSFVTLDGADHLLTRENDSLYAGTVIASWAARYIDRKEDRLPETQHRVALQAEGELFADIKIGRFRLATDATKADGGNGAAPTPIDLLLAAIGGQIEMNLQRFAKKEGIAMKGLRVHLEMEEVQKPQIRVLIEVWGKLNTMQVQLLHYAAKQITFKWLQIELKIDMKKVENSSKD
jgi:alpha/beta superfamily hydrolase/uncharacterized OsmC-like protein